MKFVYRLAGFAALALGAIGIFLPLLPTVPFMLLAAFCFARSNPALEARLLADPRFGPHIQAWRTRGAISRRGKAAAVIAFTASALLGWFLLAAPWSIAPAAIGLIGTAWTLTRPS